MNCYPKQIVVILLCFSSILEGQVLKYTPHSQNINGNVKRIDIYQYSPPSFDTLDVSSMVELKGKLTVTNKFDDRTGNLFRIERYNDSIARTVDLLYDKNENLLKSFMVDIERQLLDTTIYFYDYENREIVQTSNRKSAISVQDKFKKIKNTRRTFDSNNNMIGIEYIGMNDELLLFKRKYFDIQNRLVLLQNFENTQLERSNIYIYDSLDRKKIIQVVDRNGNIIRKSVYDYFDRGYEVSHFGSNGELKDAHRIVQFKDENDNVIKEYNFNLRRKTTLIIEYRIEYFEE